MKKAIVLGGTHDHITLIELLKYRGYYTILVDYYENPIAKEYADEFIRESTTDKENVLTIAKKKNADLVIATCIDSALATMAYVSEKLNLSCHIDYKTALSLTNKALMKEIFVNNSIPTSKHIKLNKNNLLNGKGLKLPLVIKPADANSSKGIQKIHSYNKLSSAYSTAVKYSRSKQVIAEEFIEGKELSVDVAVVNGKHQIVLITENIKSEKQKDVFTIIESKYPVELSQGELNQLNEIIKKIVNAYKLLNTPMLVQVLHNSQGFFVIEFSARIGGGSKHHFIKSITGFDILDFFVKILAKEFLQYDIKILYRYGLIKYIYTNLGKIKQINGLNELDSEQDCFAFQYKKIPIDVKSNIYSSDRIAGVLILSNNSNSFVKRLSELDAKLSFNTHKIIIG